MLDVSYSKQALKFLKHADKVLQERLMKKIEELRVKPFLHDTKTVEGYKEKLFRVRVGDYRILYEYEIYRNYLGIVKIDKRPKAY